MPSRAPFVLLQGECMPLTCPHQMHTSRFLLKTGVLRGASKAGVREERCCLLLLVLDALSLFELERLPSSWVRASRLRLIGSRWPGCSEEPLLPSWLASVVGGGVSWSVGFSSCILSPSLKRTTCRGRRR